MGTLYSAPSPSGGDDTAALQAALIACFGNRANQTDRSTNQIFQFQNGIYQVSSPLVLESVSSAIIQGCGRWATQFRDLTGNGIFKTNGFEFSTVKDMCLNAQGVNPAAVFDLDWDGNAPRPAALQGNTFENVTFSYGQVGLRIGNSGYMGSENLIKNCMFIWATTAGLATMNYNALQQTIIGGDFEECAKGIWVHKGSAPIIHGVGFQNSTTAVTGAPWTTNNWDIHVENAAYDGYSILGCRSESASFFQNQNGNVSFVHMAGCTQTCPNPGYFASVLQDTVIDSCYSKNGILAANASGGYYLRNWNAGRTDWKGTSGTGFALRTD